MLLPFFQTFATWKDLRSKRHVKRSESEPISSTPPMPNPNDPRTARPGRWRFKGCHGLRETVGKPQQKEVEAPLHMVHL